MSSSLSSGICVIAFAATLAASVAPAAAHKVETGGAGFNARPQVAEFKCATGERTQCPEGQVLRLSGEGLHQSDSIVFLGRAGRTDDRNAKPDSRSPHRVIVRVPDGATTGPVRVKSRALGSSRASKRLRVTAASASGQAPPVVPAGEGVFPVRGKYDFGSATNRFGGGRGHKGQDVFAACGTPLVSARSGTVSKATFDGRGGNYAVITADDGTSQVYMHMLKPAPITVGSRIAAGQPIGQVGETGRATGCHLHYESWTAPGWYKGGRAIDPLPELQQQAARG